MDETALILKHEAALDRVLRANVAGNLTDALKQAAIEAGIRCGLSQSESENFLRDAIEASS